MAEKVSTALKAKKRKLSEDQDYTCTSDVHTDSTSSRSPSEDPPADDLKGQSSSPDEPTKVEQRTSKWSRNALNMLQILPVITEVYTPMQILSFTFDDKNITKETVETSKSLILQSRTPLNDLDIDDLGNADAFSCFKLLLHKNLNNQWTHQVDLWDISPKIYADRLDKLQTRVCKKFQVHGELFAQQIMNMNMAKKKGTVTKAMYQKLFEEFSGLFGLTSIAEPCKTCCTIEIGETVVTSKPDIIFPDLVNSNEQKEDMNVIAVCKVRQDFQRVYVTTTAQEVLITHLSDDLIGQHGGELLAHLPLSSRNNSILGLIVQKTYVTFVHFRCDQVQFDKIKKRENKTLASKPVILFSKPYNFLKKDDRNQLIEPLLRLGFLQSSRYQ